MAWPPPSRPAFRTFSTFSRTNWQEHKPKRINRRTGNNAESCSSGTCILLVDHDFFLRVRADPSRAYIAGTCDFVRHFNVINGSHISCSSKCYNKNPDSESGVHELDGERIHVDFRPMTPHVLIFSVPHRIGPYRCHTCTARKSPHKSTPTDAVNFIISALIYISRQPFMSCPNGANQFSPH